MDSPSKIFVMKPAPHHLLATAFCVVWTLSSGCHATRHEKKEIAADTIKEHSHADVVLTNNEVKSEAPDAETQTEQGYAFPRSTEQHAQSPIDIISDKADRGKGQISLRFQSSVDTAENLGHTVELEFKEGSRCTVNGKVYASKQFHFHTPSEHLIDGATYPMEMHIVNVAKDSGGKDVYLVIGVLFKMGAENKFIKEFLDRVPAKEGEKAALPIGAVNLDDLVTQFTDHGKKSYFTYNGSLTTPPFTESVQWIVMKHILEASEDQIMKIEKMEGNNARHVQAVYDRVVYTR